MKYPYSSSHSYDSYCLQVIQKRTTCINNFGLPASWPKCLRKKAALNSLWEGQESWEEVFHKINIAIGGTPLAP